jgi:hypothetical protein
LRTFTLDTNCLIAIEKCEPEAAEVRALADAHAAGKANVAVVAMSASEKQQDGVYIKNFEEFRERLVGLDLAHLDILKPMAYWDIGFWDWCLWSGSDMVLHRKADSHNPVLKRRVFMAGLLPRQRPRSSNITTL